MTISATRPIEENAMFDAASGWALVAGIVGLAVVVACVALAWRARASGGRRGPGEPARSALVALGTILVVLGILSGERFTSYSLIGVGVVIAVLSVFVGSRSADR
jgi:hypothetical protein